MYRFILAMIEQTIGGLERRVGTAELALEAYRRIVALYEGLVVSEPEIAHYRWSLANNLLACAGLERPTVPSRAAASLDRARLVMDRLAQEDPQLRYGLAAEYARLAGSTGADDETRRTCSIQALAALRRLVAGGFRDRPQIEGNPAFGAIRSRPEFRSLMTDLAFPADPFAR
jgi:hypothetical protein